VPGSLRRTNAHCSASPASWARYTNDASTSCDATRYTCRNMHNGNETQPYRLHRNAGHTVAQLTSPRLPLHLLPNIDFNARYPNCLVSRSFSTDQSVMPRIVSNSTTPYPSMGFVSLQGMTCSHATILLPTSQQASRDRTRISTWPTELFHNLVRPHRFC